MWDTAMEEGQAVVTAILQWLGAQLRLNQGTLLADGCHLKTELREAAAALIGNRSYETGLPCDSGAEILYSDPICGCDNASDASFSPKSLSNASDVAFLRKAW